MQIVPRYVGKLKAVGYHGQFLNHLCFGFTMLTRAEVGTKGKT